MIRDIVRSLLGFLVRPCLSCRGTGWIVFIGDDRLHGLGAVHRIRCGCHRRWFP